jgi:hypothetical protein
VSWQQCCVVRVCLTYHTERVRAEHADEFHGLSIPHADVVIAAPHDCTAVSQTGKE